MHGKKKQSKGGDDEGNDDDDDGSGGQLTGASCNEPIVQRARAHNAMHV